MSTAPNGLGETSASSHSAYPTRSPAPWGIVTQGAAALAAGMGVGRFAFTPILPLMTAQAGLSAGQGANVATANYVGYLIGAIAGIVFPRLVGSRLVLRSSLVVVVATLALMPTTHSVTMWSALRLVSGIGSALIFVVAAAALLDHLGRHDAHLTGWAFGGVGAGIALSGFLVLVVRATSGWVTAWIATAVLAAVMAVASWGLAPEREIATAAEPGARASARPRTHRWFTAIFVSYTLEGIGYIVAGTFLVAAIDQDAADWVGSGAWVLAGLAALPSSVLWAWLSTRISRPVLLLTALVVQAVGIALPALAGGVAPGLVSAVLFGATFMGISTLAMGVGAHLRFPRAVAILTSGFSAGQIIGPLVVKPLLHDGYHEALLIGAAVVLAAAAAAAVLRIDFPHRIDDLLERGLRSPGS